MPTINIRLKAFIFGAMAEQNPKKLLQRTSIICLYQISDSLLSAVIVCLSSNLVIKALCSLFVMLFFSTETSHSLNLFPYVEQIYVD